MSTLAAALDLAARYGVPVFPCAASKAPLCPGGFKAATADPDAIRALWRAHPGPLIGVPTGTVSGFDALDIDAPRHPEAAAWWEANRATLPATRTHATRSGGLHLLFRHAEGLRNSASRIAEGIDVRGDGGFVIWWPAAGCDVLDRTPRATWPAWLLAMAGTPAPVPRQAPPLPGGGGADAGRRYALAALRKAVESVAQAGEGTRNHTLNREAYGLARFTPSPLSAGEIAAALAIAARDAGLSAHEATTTLTSALRAGGAA